MNRAVDFETALKDPAGAFGEPSDVVTAHGLSREQKIRLLEAWENDARLLLVASEENMGGGEPARLGAVHAALRELGVEPGEARHGAESAKTG